MSTIKFTTVPSKRLASSLTAASSTLQLNNILGWDGEALTASDFGTVLYAVLRNDANTLMEIVELDPSTIASSSITISKRGLQFDGDLTTEVTANKLSWVKNETIVELGTHVPQLLNSTVQIYNDQTIEDTKTFTTVPKSTAAPTAGSDLANKTYVDGVVGGSATTDQLIEAGIAGETVAAGEGVYFDTTDNEWKLWDADSAATVNNVKLGIAQGAGTNGNSISGGVLTQGLDTNQTGMTAGDLMYAGNTAGAMTSSTGTTERVIGIAKSATELYFDPEFYYALTATEKSSIATGTPVGMIVMYGATSAPSGWLLCDGAAVSRTTYSSLFTAISTNYGTGDGSTTFNVPNLKSAFPLGYGQRTETFDFEDADVNTGTDIITVDSNQWLITGTAVALTNSGGALPTGLSATTYYAIRQSATTIKLATTVANANAGTAVDITAASGGGTHTLTLTLTSRGLADEGGEETHALSDAELPSHTHPVTTKDGAASGGVAIGESDTGTDGAFVTGSAGSDTKHNTMPPYTVVNFIIKT